MMCSDVQSLIEAQLPTSFRCVANQGRLALVTPFTYPDGDFVEVFLLERPEQRRVLLTDLGETTRFLAGFGINIDQSSRREAVVQDICQDADVRFQHGILATSIADREQFFERLITFGQTVVRVADLMFTAKTSELMPFKEEVRDYVQRAGVKLLQDSYIAKRLDKVSLPHRPDFAFEKDRNIAVVKTLSSFTRHNANIQVAKVIRLWDYMQSHVAVDRWARVTILNDMTGVWESDWIEQMQRHSHVFMWMEDRDKLTQFLSPA